MAITYLKFVRPYCGVHLKVWERKDAWETRTYASFGTVIDLTTCIVSK